MTTGIATALAEVLELQDQPDQAYDVYSDALVTLRNAYERLNHPERHRAVQLAYKLGTMAKQCGKAADEEERYLVFAVEEMLKLLLEVQQDPKLRNSLGSSEPFSLGQIPLPSWISKTDVGAPLEALAAFYKEAGKFEYVSVSSFVSFLNVSQLRHASIPSSHLTDDTTRLYPSARPVSRSALPFCSIGILNTYSGAEFMGHLAETILLRSTSPESLHQAEVWAQSGLSILQEAQKSSRKEPICDTALVAAFINVATLQEVQHLEVDRQVLFLTRLR